MHEYSYKHVTERNYFQTALITIIVNISFYHTIKALRTGSYSDGGARPNVDYADNTIGVAFAVGEISQPATIRILGDDNIVEGPKRFHVDLVYPADGRVSTPGSATVNIVDDDGKIMYKILHFSTLGRSGPILK